MLTVDNWATAQTVTVRPDSDGANDTGTLTHTASGGDYDEGPAGDGRQRHRAQRDGPHRDGGRRRGVELHRQAGHPALGQRHGLHYRTRRHGPEPVGNHAEQQHADLHGGQLGRCADGDGQGGPGQRRGQRHRDADAHRLGRGLRQHNEGPAGDGYRQRRAGHRAQRDGPHRDGGRRHRRRATRSGWPPGPRTASRSPLQDTTART